MSASKQNPSAIARTWAVIGFGLASTAVLFGLWLLGQGAERTMAQAPHASEQTAEEKAEAQCALNLQCWGDKHTAAAGIYCADPVERLAKYSHQWTDGFFEMKFTKFKWIDPAAGTMMFRGDRVQFQNGFGAYQRMQYDCDFNTRNNVVLGVRARPLY